MSLPPHGGNAARIERDRGFAAGTLLDFSANIAPAGPPPAVAAVLAETARDPHMLSAYPDEDYADVRVALAALHDVDPQAIVIGGGGSGLLDAAMRFAGARSIVVPVPAFSEYERAARANNVVLLTHPLDAGCELDVDRFVARVAAYPGAAALVNSPHNPSGRALDRTTLTQLVLTLARQQRAVIVDEAFADYAPECALDLSTIEAGRVVVVRSLTKFYSLAGVRIGYAIVDPARRDALRFMLPSWPAGSLDARIALAALQDRRHAERTRRMTVEARSTLLASLQAIGITTFPSVANFVLAELPVDVRHMDRLLERLIVDHQIIVRDARTYHGFEQRAIVRIAVLDRAVNERLVRALECVLSSRRFEHQAIDGRAFDGRARVGQR